MIGARQIATLLTLGLALLAACPPGTAFAQMPDARQMSGIPRPVTDLPDRTVSVRVVRGSLANNLPNQDVEFTVDGKSTTVKTDENGRAELGSLPAGAALKAATTVDGERLESQTFPVPGSGGVRLLLVATDRAQQGQAAGEAAPPAAPGTVVIAGESRMVIEPDEEDLRVYYILDVVNGAPTPVFPQTPFEFELPTGAVGAAVLDGSTPNATVTGTRVRVNGAFPPGNTLVQVGFILPLRRGGVDVQQVFPATLQHVGIIVRKLGEATLTSPQIARQQDLTSGGLTYIAAAGGSVPAGQPVTFTLEGLPHHSTTPMYVALGLAILTLAAGGWFARRPASAGKAERRELIARRERLFHELVRLENEHRRGRSDGARYRTRREELLAALEHVYGALDSDDTGPEPADRAGVAA
ncbi:MAG: hypothetical protein AB7O32_02325 [Vicinamibacterales bacterium]